MKQLIVRVTESELAGIKASVASAGISQNRWLRSKILGTPDGTPATVPAQKIEPQGGVEQRVKQLMAQGDTSVLARKKAMEEYGIHD